MKNSFYTIEELNQIGLKSIGENVMISRFAQLYGVDNMEIGNHVRIDDFCILSGNIKLGNYIHISAYCALYGKFGIEMEDYSGLSPRCTIFSASDDFSGNFMIGPMVNSKYTNVIGGKVHLKKYSQLGSNCVVLPKVIINEGVAVGAMSLIIKDLKAWKVYIGIPAKILNDRKKELINFDNDKK
jgi:acetyltransferase-like isoleucine patch superfamily enzyme